MALTKAEMAERLFNELGLNKREAKEIVELFFEEIRAALESNESVKLSGFGNFGLARQKRKTGKKPENRRRNPNFSASRGNIQAWPETQATSRDLCWNRATMKSYR